MRLLARTALVLSLALSATAAGAGAPPEAASPSGPTLVLDVGAAVSFAENGYGGPAGNTWDTDSYQGAASGSVAGGWAFGRHLVVGLRTWAVAAFHDRLVVGVGPTLVVRRGAEGPFAEITPAVTGLWIYGGPNKRAKDGGGVQGAVGWIWGTSEHLRLGFQVAASYSHNAAEGDSGSWNSRSLSAGLVVAL